MSGVPSRNVAVEPNYTAVTAAAHPSSPPPTRPRHFGMALRFLLAQQTGRTPAIRNTNCVLPTAHGAITADIYEPERARHQLRGTMLLVHGMSQLGQRDPRLIGLARALAGLGWRVVAPGYDEIRHTRIEAASITRIAATMLALGADPQLAPSGRIAVVSASFSGSLSLLAATDPAAATRVSALLAIGAFGRVEAVVEYLMCADDADDYGRLILLRNFAPRIATCDEELLSALDVAIADNFHNRTDPELPRLLARLSPTTRAALQRMRYDPAWRRDAGPRMLAQIPELRRALDVTEAAARLRSPVFLLHGTRDNVIPAAESQAIAAAVRAAGGYAQAVITPFIGHGDAKIRPSMARELWRLTACVAGFLAAAET